MFAFIRVHLMICGIFRFSINFIFCLNQVRNIIQFDKFYFIFDVDLHFVRNFIIADFFQRNIVTARLNTTNVNETVRIQILVLADAVYRNKEFLAFYSCAFFINYHNSQIAFHGTHKKVQFYCSILTNFSGKRLILIQKGWIV